MLHPAIPPSGADVTTLPEFSAVVQCNTLRWGALCAELSGVPDVRVSVENGAQVVRYRNTPEARRAVQNAIKKAEKHDPK